MKLIDLNNPKIGDLRFPINLTNAPTIGYIVSASAGRLYKDGMPIEGQLSKINLNIVNYELVKLVRENGGTESDLSTISAEYIADNDTLQKISVENLIGKAIDLRDAQCGLKWVSRGSGGNWGGIKIILNKLKSPNQQKGE